MRMKTLAWVVMTALMLAGCDIINPDEQIPAYVYIPSVSLQTQSAQGSASENIREVYLTANGQSLGAYRVPSAVPILAAGPSEIRLQAGIRDNGITLAPNLYPFYAVATYPIDLAPGQTDTLPPVVFRYADEAQFAFIEDFEDPLLEFEDMDRTSDQVLEGSFSGLIELDSLNAVRRFVSTLSYSNLTANSPQVYLEMDYLSDAPLAVGVAGQPAIPEFPPLVLESGFLPSPTWNKIYFSLGGLLQEGQFGTIQIVMEAFISSQDQLGEDGVARIYLDNIKLVHF